MNTKTTITSLITFFVACLSPIQAKTWTSSDGRTLEASFVSFADGKVTLKRDQDGKQFVLPLERLSEKDRTWVAEKKKAGAQDPPLKKQEAKPASGLFENRLTGDWEFMEYKKLPFRFYGASDLDPTQRYPVFVWLHATGQCGNDNKQQVTTIPRAISSPGIYKKHPSLIIAPHCDKNSGGWDGKNLKNLLGILKEMKKNLPVDPNRIYVMGSSMGGFGVWNALAEEPKLFAAGVPVAGGGSPGIARSIKKVGIWAFHGADDKIVLPSQSQEMVKAIKRAKGKVKYTEYPGEGHGVAGKALNEPGFIEWLFSQDRSKD